MTFNENADISGGKASRRGGGRGMKIGGGAGGGAVLIAIVVLLVQHFTGVDVSGVAGGLTGLQGQQIDTSGDEALSCTAAEANTDANCRIQGAAALLQDYWAGEVRGYTDPQGIVIFDQSTNTGCGAASTDMGPFYCPNDQTIYIDPAFYDELAQQFGDDAGALAQLYVIGHEWGHHVQNITGTMRGKNLSATGPASDSVRLELQADCYAGAWLGDATTETDENGEHYLKPITKDQITDALNAAAAVGDDHIQQTTQGQVNPEGFTHGTSAERQKWFNTGLAGSPASCQTFGIPASQLG
ncbi:neutral zinc metallopeptidase [Gryllotalpicola kribbensis]|jgi:predicted metalloprotease|uniref:Neutral zinc metallopeptidase n=1 Tax=Gryllotalpicola kribbensis TaxID=993084 RepID=A0ABP8AS53_9MICO